MSTPEHSTPEPATRNSKLPLLIALGAILLSVTIVMLGAVGVLNSELSSSPTPPASDPSARQPSSTTPATTTPPIAKTFTAKPSDTSSFLNDDYVDGVASFEFTGPGARFLGTDPKHEVIVGIQGITSGTKSKFATKLIAYRTDTSEKIYEIPVKNCSPMSNNSILYCSKEDSAEFHAIDPHTGETTQTYTFDYTRDIRNYIASFHGIDFIQLENPNTDKSSSAELVALQDGVMLWKHKITKESQCRALEAHEKVICATEITSGHGYTVELLQAVTGKPELTRSKAASVELYADGWKEQDPAAEVRYFNTEGKVVASSQPSIPTTIFPDCCASNNYAHSEEILYPIPVSVKDPQRNVILDGNGNIAFSLAEQNRQIEVYERQTQGRTVSFEVDTSKEMMYAVSKRADLILIHRTINDSFVLYDTISKRELITGHIQPGDMTVSYGLLVTRGSTPKNTNVVTVYVPDGSTT